MTNWLDSMQQTFEYYVVDPNTWRDKEKINTVLSCSITRDLDVETLGSATIDVTESLGECYIRVYLVTVQNGVREKHPLGTFLVQSPSFSFDGKNSDHSLDAYTPLIELKENQPPLGYYVDKEENIMSIAYMLTREHARAPVVETRDDETIPNYFVANTEDNWLVFLRDLIANAKYKFALDEMGRILFSPDQDTASLQPVWTYDDSNSSILQPEITVDRDIYGIPNVVEVIHSSSAGCFVARVVNDDENSPTSTISRGREIVHRVTNPESISNPTETRVKEYATNLLKTLSSLEYTLSYTHGYCPVRIGDCVRLNYARAGLTNIKAKVVSQDISCELGCPVSERAVFTTKLWR